MKKTIAKKLIKINNDFYKTVAPDFSGSRNYPWAGWEFLFSRFNKEYFIPATVLDLGCGNGRFSKVLKQNYPDVAYVGVDNNEKLLEIAGKTYPDAKFLNADILAPWELKENFDLIVAFGVMHHLPGEEIRKQFLEQINAHLNPEGYVVLAFWNFIKIPALLKRFGSWDQVGIDDTEIDPGDWLLDWRRGPGAFRYCHQYNIDEISALFLDTGFKIISKFNADGPGNDVNTYYLLQKN